MPLLTISPLPVDCWFVIDRDHVTNKQQRCDGWKLLLKIQSLSLWSYLQVQRKIHWDSTMAWNRGCYTWDVDKSICIKWIPHRPSSGTIQVLHHSSLSIHINPSCHWNSWNTSITLNISRYFTVLSHLGQPSVKLQNQNSWMVGWVYCLGCQRNSCWA